MITIENLLKTYNNDTQGELLQFSGIDGYDGYNISKQFIIENKDVIAVRVEKRDSEYSTIMFFENVDINKYELIKEAKTLSLQDPFVTKIKDQIVLGGVEVKEREDGNGLEWKTNLYFLKDLQNIEKFFEGPQGMKDLRLVEVEDQIGVFTRPQGDKGGRGKIGFYMAQSFEDITIANIDDAPLIDDMFIGEEWGGANDAIYLGDNKIGVLGHIAKFDDNNMRHYYPMSFIYNITTHDYTDVNIIFKRENFEKTDAKKEDLYDVVFPGGFNIESENVRIYCGLSDTSAGSIVIPNPFKED